MKSGEGQLADSETVAIYQLTWKHVKNGVDGTVITVLIGWLSALLLKYIFLPAFPLKFAFLYLVLSEPSLLKLCIK